MDQFTPPAGLLFAFDRWLPARTRIDLTMLQIYPKLAFYCRQPDTHAVYSLDEPLSSYFAGHRAPPNGEVLGRRPSGSFQERSASDADQ
jgi:hypothetical protein